MINLNAEKIAELQKMVNYEIDDFNLKALKEEIETRIGETGQSYYEIPARESKSGRPEIVWIERIEKYTIDYCNGMRNEIEVDSLATALQEAQKNMSYTQCDTKILNADGEAVALSKWYGAQPSKDDTPLETFGTYGFYDSWIDPETYDYI